jgi:hypothetical protein
MRGKQHTEENSSKLRSMSTSLRQMEMRMNLTNEKQNFYSIKIKRDQLQTWRSPPYLPHLIGIKNAFLTHFYTTNVKMKLKSGKEPQPSGVLYIGSSKRLNDYYALRA